MTEPGAREAAPTERKARRLWVLLIVSLAFNLLIIGAVGGSMLAWKKHGPWRGSFRGEDYGLLGFSRSLPAERRSVIGKAIRQERLSMRPLWREMHEARREAADVLGVEPYDRDKVKAAIDKITDSEMKLKAAGRALFLNTAERLTPEERRELVEWWRKKARRHFGFGDKDELPDDKKASSP